jgi:hypothetical protein
LSDFLSISNFIVLFCLAVVDKVVVKRQPGPPPDAEAQICYASGIIGFATVGWFPGHQGLR